MSGETRGAVSGWARALFALALICAPAQGMAAEGSGWTVETARENVLQIIEANDKRYAEKFKAEEAARIAQDRAVSIANEAAEKWRQNANEWRQAMLDRERAFMPRLEYEKGYINLENRVAALESHSLGSIAEARGSTVVWGYVVGAAGATVGLVTLLFTFTRRRPT